MAVLRLTDCLNCRWDSTTFAGLNLTTLPEFPPFLKNINAEDNLLSAETIEQLQKNNENPQYSGPKVSWSVAQKADESAGEHFDYQGTWSKDITLIHTPGPIPAAEKTLQPENRVRIDILLSALNIHIDMVSRLDTFKVSDKAVKEFAFFYKWMPENMARDILSSFVEYIKENISQLNLHETVKKDVSKHGAGHFAIKNMPEKRSDAWLSDLNRGVNTFWRKGNNAPLNSLDSKTTNVLDQALGRKIFKLALDWGQKEEVKALFIINDSFKHSINKEEALAEAKAFDKAAYKPIEFSVANAIAKKNMHNIMFEQSASPESSDVDVGSDNNNEMLVDIEDLDFDADIRSGNFWDGEYSDSDSDSDIDSDGDIEFEGDIDSDGDINLEGDIDLEGDTDSDSDIASDRDSDSDSDSD